MEMIDRLRKKLSEEYGINSDAELEEAINNQKLADIGIFVSPCSYDQNAGADWTPARIA